MNATKAIAQIDQVLRRLVDYETVDEERLGHATIALAELVLGADLYECATCGAMVSDDMPHKHAPQWIGR